MDQSVRGSDWTPSRARQVARVQVHGFRGHVRLEEVRRGGLADDREVQLFVLQPTRVVRSPWSCRRDGLFVPYFHIFVVCITALRFRPHVQVVRVVGVEKGAQVSSRESCLGSRCRNQPGCSGTFFSSVLHVFAALGGFVGYCGT